MPNEGVNAFAPRFAEKGSRIENLRCDNLLGCVANNKKALPICTGRALFLPIPRLDEGLGIGGKLERRGKGSLRAVFDQAA